jgi:hypothetical protein
MEIRAQLTLEKGVGFNGSPCDYGFQGCAPLGDFGNITYIQLWTFFSRGSDGRCRFNIFSFNAIVQTCFGADNANLDACTQPASGGSCQHSMGNTDAIGQSCPSECDGSMAFEKSQTVVWADFNNISVQFRGHRPTGEPLRRDIGNVTCDSIDSTSLNEAEHTIISRLSVRVV